MAGFNSLLIILLVVVFLTIADAGLRTPSLQFSKASASARSFGNPKPPVFEPKRQNQFGARPSVPGPPSFGRSNSGSSINIAKSVSISTGGNGGARSSSSAFGK